MVIQKNIKDNHPVDDAESCIAMALNGLNIYYLASLKKRKPSIELVPQDL
jgi:hypothetical protein